jgi:hypothetical protein
VLCYRRPPRTFASAVDQTRYSTDLGLYIRATYRLRRQPNLDSRHSSSTVSIFTYLTTPVLG